MPLPSPAGPPSVTAVVYCEATFGAADGKTANGLVRSSERYKILSVIDSQKAGRDAGEVLGEAPNGIPVCANLDDAIARAGIVPDSFIFGMAPASGMLSPIERRLVLTERQIALSDPRTERLEATGLDYLGKVRVVERALRSPGDRLEVLYRLPGEEPVRALLRPVRLDKNDKGLVLEAEDLGTGGPARVPLGALSTVRRVRASLFGDDQ